MNYSQQRSSKNKSRKPASREEPSEFVDKVVSINRVAKVVKGGRRFGFAALVVSGDEKGKIGIGYGKAKEVSEAIRKATEEAHKSMFSVQLKNNTIPHEIVGRSDGGRVLLKPASPGTGVIAGGGVRPVLLAAGVKDILTKSMGSDNSMSVVKATIKALKGLRSAERIAAIRSA